MLFKPLAVSSVLVRKIPECGKIPYPEKAHVFPLKGSIPAFYVSIPYISQPPYIYAFLMKKIQMDKILEKVLFYLKKHYCLFYKITYLEKIIWLYFHFLFV